MEWAWLSRCLAHGREAWPPPAPAHCLTTSPSFPDFGLLDMVIPHGFTAESWFKNSCPSFELAGPDDYASGWPLLTIVIDYADTTEHIGSRHSFYELPCHGLEHKHGRGVPSFNACARAIKA